MFFRHRRIIRRAGKELCKTALIPGAPVVLAGLIGAIGLAGLIYLKKKADEERGTAFGTSAKAAAERRRKETAFEEENIFDEEPVIRKKPAGKTWGTKKTSRRSAVNDDARSGVTRRKGTSGKTAKTETSGVKKTQETEVPYVDMWVANARTKRFHIQGCGEIRKIGKSNLEDIAGSLDELIERGYVPCSKCVQKR